jgi:ribosomal protein S18 acetylase RimI-like enzyme
MEVRELAGGIVGYCGIPGPLSEAAAVGIDCDVTAATVDEMTEFFRARGCAPRLTVSPLTNPELAPLLSGAGYVPIEYQNTLLADVHSFEAERNNRVCEAVDARAWGEANARGFSDGEDPSHELRMMSTLLATGGAVALEARDRETIISTSCFAMEKERGIVALFAASTLPSHRRQGWQRAMIRERIARAKEAGMEFARVSAAPLSDSERNFRALGFVPLYTRVTWELRN